MQFLFQRIKENTHKGRLGAEQARASGAQEGEPLPDAPLPFPLAASAAAVTVAPAPAAIPTTVSGAAKK